MQISRLFREYFSRPIWSFGKSGWLAKRSNSLCSEYEGAGRFDSFQPETKSKHSRMQPLKGAANGQWSTLCCFTYCDRVSEINWWSSKFQTSQLPHGLAGLRYSFFGNSLLAIGLTIKPTLILQTHIILVQNLKYLPSHKLLIKLKENINGRLVYACKYFVIIYAFSIEYLAVSTWIANAIKFTAC